MYLAHAVAAQHLAAHATDRQFATTTDEVAAASERATQLAIARAERAARRLEASTDRRPVEHGRHLAPKPA